MSILGDQMVYKIFIFLIFLILTACNNNSSIIDPQDVNSFFSSDMPNSPGIWWIYEYHDQDNNLDLVLNREILESQSDISMIRNIYINHDSTVLDIDTIYYKITEDDFSIKQTGQWKKYMLFPAARDLRWTTGDGDQLTVVSTTESVKLTSGEFFNCVKVVSQKENRAYYYANGIGLLIIENLDESRYKYLKLISFSELL